MLNWLLRNLIKSLLRLRYRVEVRGLKEIAARGRAGILFLPNHPALIDPIIMMATLMKDFAPRALADKDQVDRFFIRRLARRAGVRGIPGMDTYGLAGREQIERMLAESIEGLRRGENLLLYPAGRIYRQWQENLGGNSAVELILQKLPDVRVVLVRSTGLWGSGFSWAAGHCCNAQQMVRKGLWAVPANFFLFTPKRQVTIEFSEPADLPRSDGRDAINRYLEAFYNRSARHNTYVPYTIWERGGTRELPEPAVRASAESLEHVSANTRWLVVDHLRELSGKSAIADEDRLANELGLDSLARAELIVWLEKEFGFPQAGPDALVSVADVLLAASGESVGQATVHIKPPPSKWFWRGSSTRAKVFPGGNVAEVFLNQARAHPSRIVLADQTAGVRSNRQIITAALALQPALRALPGRNVGIMLPASVGATVTYFAALFAGKTPVMVNWTAGTRNILHGLDALDVCAVLTAEAMAARLSADGMDLSGLKDRFVFLERLGKGLSIWRKLSAAVRARLGLWGPLRAAQISPTAVVLFTSGSENLPKAVPLSHANVLANLADVAAFVELHEDDKLLGMLPPFHSFGLTVTTLLPLCLGLRCCYWPNPTQGSALAAVAQAYRPTITVGTPTFLAGIARAAEPGQLDSLRLAVTGSEKCPPRVYEALERACPNAIVLEGYGITECSPIVSVNDPRQPVRQTIGRPLPSVEWAIVDLDSGRRVAVGQPGMLLVRGPSVFAGYLNYSGPSPFVEFEAKSWYRTGDLVSQDAAGVLTFVGRLKRFVKLGGEMISLPAIESALEERLISAGLITPELAQQGPSIAVEGTATEPTELVLFTTLELTREQANQHLRAAGLPPLQNLRRVIRLAALPVLGTGKIDYRALRTMLK